MRVDAVPLAQELIRFETVNPPGAEKACAEHLARVLEPHGFVLQRYEHQPTRTNLVARFPGHQPGLAPLVFTGHLDTVPLGQQPWSVPPFAGEIRGGRLYGRGSSDMKAGVAAFVSAAVEVASAGGLQRGLTLVITAGEETGSEGARHLAKLDVLGAASALVVAEPTSNQLAVAHKGALHLRAQVTGRTAHGSMPHLGENAISKALSAITRLEAYSFQLAPHPLLGGPTMAVTSIRAGENVNSIPDTCTFTLDVRTIPGMDHAKVLAELRSVLGPSVQLDVPLADMPPVGTDPEDPFVRCVCSCIGKGETVAIGLPYFTDASVLQAAYIGCPTVVLGPGEPGQAHQTDEFCPVERITEATSIYQHIVERWCRLV
jgi:succinyl-diaminopimelate desuccinylase